ncbi:MAG: STAS domain-containing protein [bacterium]|jgi:anti-anti-sigma factor|nr:STAS domain-containing protein [bacterium]
MRLNRTDLDTVTIFSFEDDDQIRDPEFMRMAVDALQKENRINILFDFSNIHYISSSVLGFLITAYRELEARGGRLKLVNVQPSVANVLEITRLNRVLEMFNDKETAIRSF